MINVLIADDQKMVRDWFRSAIESSGRYNLAAEADSGHMAQSICDRGGVDLVLMDVVFVGRQNGLDAAEYIKSRHPDIKVIVVTSMPEHSYITRARAIGVDSFWYKESADQPILELMDRTVAGEKIYPDTTPRLNMGFALSAEFTDAEYRILRELVAGYTNREIAEILGVTPDAVKKHINNMLAKTGYRSRTQLAVKVSTMGLVIRDEGN